MKSLLLISVALLSFKVFTVNAQSDITPDFSNPVVGLIGASYVDPEAPIGNTSGLTSLNGASYRGIADYLKGTTIHKAGGLVYRENAQGGATSDGANGFKTMLQQAQELVEHTTMWSDGSHMKAAVLFQFNDCKHTLAGLCPTQAEVLAGPVANTLDTIAYLQSQNVKVFVVKMPSYEQLDLALTESIFSAIIPDFKTANEAQYQLIQTSYEDYIYNEDGVTVIEAWKTFEHIGDGLHPNHKSKATAAKIINKTLEKALLR
ncbi:hypothetical protein [Catenovulum sediminis]|uniref:SGNH hydrolase-type esterase domain-containing protein n=1 Tax=Catenovulum sediminis TaxID=1740262 RepID=A0ABV1RG60_9ALTE